MLALEAAFLNPTTVGYTPKNDLKAFYETRYTHSFNTANPWTDIEGFMQDYATEIKGAPVFIGEYHATMSAAKEDMKGIIKLAESMPKMFLGVSFFEFQVRYDKGGTELGFGMFGLGDFSLQTMDYFGAKYDVWCLVPVMDPIGKAYSLNDAVTTAFGGVGIDVNELCIADPAKVKLTQEGFGAILTRHDSTKMAVFAQRVVEHMGGLVLDAGGLATFAALYSGASGTPKGDFADLASDLGRNHPDWASWDNTAACVADRSSSLSSLGDTISYACSHMKSLNCGTDIPANCSSYQDPLKLADYVFSAYFNEMGNDQPLENCYSAGAMVYAHSKSYRQWDSICVLTTDPDTTAMTELGYKEILSLGTDKVAEFIRRVVKLEDYQVGDEQGLKRYAASPPASLAQLKSEIKAQPWVCGGDTLRNCGAPPPSPPPGTTPGSSTWLIVAVVAAAVAVAALLGVVVWRRKQAREQRSSLRDPFRERIEILASVA